MRILSSRVPAHPSSMLIAPGWSGCATECVGPATTGYTRDLGRLYLKTHMTEPIAGVPRGRGARRLPVTSTRATGVASEGGMACLCPR